MSRSGSNKTVWYMNIAASLVCLSLVSLSPAQTYDLELTATSGGGASSGVPYVLRGTIGQANAAYSTAGQYELSSGFWPAGPSCIVEFHYFARFAEQWLQTPCDVGNDWCDGADLDKLGDVDLIDLKMLVNEWLYYCPYHWPSQ